MSEISRTALFGKLNPLAYKAIEGATVFCKMRGNPYVELEHWFAQLLQNQESDLHRLLSEPYEQNFLDRSAREAVAGRVAASHSFDGRAEALLDAVIDHRARTGS